MREVRSESVFQSEALEPRLLWSADVAVLGATRPLTGTEQILAEKLQRDHATKAEPVLASEFTFTVKLFGGLAEQAEVIKAWMSCRRERIRWSSDRWPRAFCKSSSTVSILISTRTPIESA